MKHHKNTRYAGTPVYEAEYARCMAKGYEPAMANVFATSRARWAAATRGMSVERKREFANALHEMQQETWRREERER